MHFEAIYDNHIEEALEEALGLAFAKEICFALERCIQDRVLSQDAMKSVIVFRKFFGYHIHPSEAEMHTTNIDHLKRFSGTLQRLFRTCCHRDLLSHYFVVCLHRRPCIASASPPGLGLPGFGSNAKRVRLM